jgi:hypothetical protein
MQGALKPGDRVIWVRPAVRLAGLVLASTRMGRLRVQLDTGRVVTVSRAHLIPEAP